MQNSGIPATNQDQNTKSQLSSDHNNYSSALGTTVAANEARIIEKAIQEQTQEKRLSRETLLALQDLILIQLKGNLVPQVRAEREAKKEAFNDIDKWLQISLYYAKQGHEIGNTVRKSFLASRGILEDIYSESVLFHSSDITFANIMQERILMFKLVSAIRASEVDENIYTTIISKAIEYYSTQQQDISLLKSKIPEIAWQGALSERCSSYIYSNNGFTLEDGGGFLGSNPQLLGQYSASLTNLTQLEQAALANPSQQQVLQPSQIQPQLQQSQQPLNNSTPPENNAMAQNKNKQKTAKKKGCKCIIF